MDPATTLLVTLLGQRTQQTKLFSSYGLGAGDAEVEGVTKEDNIIKVNIVDFLVKLQINMVSHKPPVNIYMEDDHVLNVSGSKDNEANKVEEQLEAEAINDPKVKDESESLIENTMYKDEELQT
ncbi:hypothetical protein Tco_0222543 [Tanacetum coccineum]